ncbi:hypothetical protein [Streptococcus sp. LYSM12]|nr:hypothetical protein [Streptococcus sp. LYSM12]MCQ9214483.1 hypothetical protein [Streptococcus sp. O1]
MKKPTKLAFSNNRVKNTDKEREFFGNFKRIFTLLIAEIVGRGGKIVIE